MIETVERIRQEWHKCPIEYRNEDNVTIMSEQAGLLILVNVEKFSTEDGLSAGFRCVPVKHNEMEITL
ncbi:MAG: hypothetical protein KAS32_23395 [Candidatus Peribacteraceae bacterium]|nr:hypothetical protein [Candidatus Peribacteraceae bacterium]